MPDTPLTWPPIVAIALLALIGGGAIGYAISDSSGGETTTTATATTTATTTVAEEAPLGTTDETGAVAETTTEAPSESDLEARLNCDYLISGGNMLVAGGLLENVGDAPLEARVTATWELLGSAPREAEETLNLDPGETANVALNLDVTGDEIDQHQSANGRCDVDAEVLDAG
jgi:hypothetical protein